MDKVDGMLLWNMHSWDLSVDSVTGAVGFPIHRHDGSLLIIPMALGLAPVGNPDMKFVCLNGQYAGYFGYQTGWKPQAV